MRRLTTLQFLGLFVFFCCSQAILFVYSWDFSCFFVVLRLFSSCRELLFIFEGLVFACYHSVLVVYVGLSPAFPLAPRSLFSVFASLLNIIRSRVLLSATNDSLIPIHMNFLLRNIVKRSVILANRLRCRCLTHLKYASHILNDLLSAFVRCTPDVCPFDTVLTTTNDKSRMTIDIESQNDVLCIFF
jgi:hypothetical protein